MGSFCRRTHLKSLDVEHGNEMYYDAERAMSNFVERSSCRREAFALNVLDGCDVSYLVNAIVGLSKGLLKSP